MSILQMRKGIPPMVKKLSQESYQETGREADFFFFFIPALVLLGLSLMTGGE